MRKITKFKVALTIILVFVLTFALMQSALASGTKINFPIYASNETDLLGDANTLYVTELVQNPTSKLITATVKIVNNTTSGKPLVLTGAGVQISFDNRVAPYWYDTTKTDAQQSFDFSRFYNGGPTVDITESGKYCAAPHPVFKSIGTITVQNNASGRFIGAKISTESEKVPFSIQPGESATICKFYFMPTNNSTVIDMNMFKFQWSEYTDKIIRLSTWFNNGTRYVVSNEEYPAAIITYVLSPTTFKMHFFQAPPTGLVANNTTRQIDGYNATTMEWATNAAGPYTSAHPTVPQTGATYWVRFAATAYTGTDGEYVNYKRYMASDPVEIIFLRDHYPAIASVTKSCSTPPNTDGKWRPGDTITYTVRVQNIGDPQSTWKNVILTDTLPSQVTFVAGSVKVDGATFAGYTFAGGMLTVPLGNLVGQAAAKVVTFDVTINSTATTVSPNTASVKGDDGDTGKEVEGGDTDEDGPKTLVLKSAPPTIDPITAGDTTVTGTGVPGASIVLELPDGTKRPAVVVGGDGKWSVPGLPPAVAGDIYKAVQTEPTKDPSIEVQRVVDGRPPVIKTGTKKYSTNLTEKTRSDGTWRVGDILEYTIEAVNSGDPKSLWENVIVTDMLPDLKNTGIQLVDYIPGNTTTIDGVPAGTAATFNATTGTLTANLGNIAGGVTKKLVFQVKINENAYGKQIINEATVGDVDVKDPDIPPPVTDRSPMPTIDEINEGDRTIYGTGIAGGLITVTFPNYTPKPTTTVGADGKWSMQVPGSINLIQGDKVEATQTIAPLDPSLPAVAIVQGKKNVIPSVIKESNRLTIHPDGKTRVGDRITYKITITNNGPKSVWQNVIFTDNIPKGLTYVTNSVRLNGQVPTYSSWVDPRLQVTIGDIAYGVTHVITFDATVNADAYGIAVLNECRVEGKDNGTDLGVDEKDKDGPFTVVPKSDPPTIDPVYRGDKEITGTGKPGADIIVILPDGTELPTKVENDGTWKVTVPSGKEPNTDDRIEAIQIEPDKDPSDKVFVIVTDKNHRAIHGLVWPLITPITGATLPDNIIKMHDCVVELRATFNTPAPAALKTIAVLTNNDNTDYTGEFTINNVPFGTYVLYIKRAGFLTRTMMVTISPSTPDIYELKSTGVGENGVFNLMWGDSIEDNKIDPQDFGYIQSLIDLGITYTSTLYDAACDLNGDGKIDPQDLMFATMYRNKTIADYAGVEGVDFSK
jgi:uncharacterized repeat protein (TIGR01451 family)